MRRLVVPEGEVDVILYWPSVLAGTTVIEILGPHPFRHYSSLPKAHEMFRDEHSSLGIKYVMVRLMSYLGIALVLLGLLLVLSKHLGAA